MPDREVLAALVALAGVGWGVWKERRNRADNEAFERYKFDQEQKRAESTRHDEAEVSEARELGSRIERYYAGELARITAERDRFQSRCDALDAECDDMTRRLRRCKCGDTA